MGEIKQVNEEVLAARLESLGFKGTAIEMAIMLFVRQPTIAQLQFGKIIFDVGGGERAITMDIQSRVEHRRRR